MTPLDRIFEKFPAAKDLLFWLDDNLVFIFGVPFVLFILFVFFWASISAPRKAKRILRSLEKEGYSPVPSGNPRLENALKRLTPNMLHTYELSTVTETSPWRIEIAYGKHDEKTSKFFALINRSVHRTTRANAKVEYQFTIAFFETRALPFRQEVHVAGDRYSLDPNYELREVDKKDIELLSSCFVLHTRDGKLDALLPSFQEALMKSSSFLSIRAERENRNDPFLHNARMRFTSKGWGLISNEFIYDKKKMAALLRAVNSISESLPCT